MRKPSEPGVADVAGFLIGGESKDKSPARSTGNSRRRRERQRKRARSFGEPAVQNGLISVDAAIPEERPVASRVLAFGGIAFHDQNFFLFRAGLRDDLAERIRYKRIAPKFDAGIAVGGIAFEAHAVYHGHVDAVSDGMRALNRTPRVKLPRAELRLLRRMPADAGGIKNNLRALQSRHPRAFRVPLIPADLHADAAVARVEIRKAQISRRKVKLFVVRSEEHTSELQSHVNLVCRLLLEKKKKTRNINPVINNATYKGNSMKLT